MQEIAEKGDQYAKRMLGRKKEQDQSPECYSKSIRRRLSIMEAIKGKVNTPPRVVVRSCANPFKKEFSNESATTLGYDSDDLSRSYVTNWPDDNVSPIAADDEADDERTRLDDQRALGDLNDDDAQQQQVVITTASSTPSSRAIRRARRRGSYQPQSQQHQQQQRTQQRATSELYYASPPAYCETEVDSGKPRMSIDANFNEIDYYHRPKQFIFPSGQDEQEQQQHREELRRVAEDGAEDGDVDGRVSVGAYAPEEKRSSMYIGEYLHRANESGLLASTYAPPVFTTEQLQSQNYLVDVYEQDFQLGNAELERKGVDQFFGARVLEILEPQIVQVDRHSDEQAATSTNHRQRASMKFVQDTFHQGIQQLQRDELDSATTSFVSDIVREPDYEAEKPQYRPPSANTVRSQHQVSQPKISETPVRIYPQLDLSAELAEKVTPKKLFHKSNIQDTSESVYGDNFYTNTTATFEDFQKTSNLENEAFSTPLTIPVSQPSADDHHHQDHHQNHHRAHQHQDDAQSANSSFIKRSTSFLFQNLPNLLRRKPNLESTRHLLVNGRAKIPSPGMSHMASTISTITIPNTPASPAITYEQAQAYQDYQRTIQADNQRDMENTIPYEVENFFKLAVGDEYSSTMVTYAPCDMQDQLSSHINASELISEETTPVNNVIHVMRVPKTEQPNHSSTLNRTLSFYKTLTQRIKKKFRGSIKDREDNFSQPEMLLPDAFPSLKDSVKKLLEEVDIQQTLIYQASKALELCSSMREFVASSERVESERLLMLASLRKKAALDEIRRLTSQQPGREAYCERADVTLSNISLQLRDGALRCERQQGDFVEWFVVVVTQGLTVWASQAFVCPKLGTKLDVTGKITIPDLTPDFRISVKVYNLKLEQQALYNHEEKYHIAKKAVDNRQSASCPSAKKLLRKVERKRTFISPKQFEIKFSGIKESSFNLCGSVDLMLHDLNLLPPWPLNGVPPNSVLYGTLELSLSSDLHLAVSHAGFLTVGDEAGGFAVWNRRWCILEGRHLHFWNYPREQECKPPLYSIDLVSCVSRRINLIDRSMCARPRTLLVETSRRRKAIDRNTIVVELRTSCTILRNLLSCDTNQDLVEWQTKLNHVVCALREWSIMESKPISYGNEVSDL